MSKKIQTSKDITYPIILNQEQTNKVVQASKLQYHSNIQRAYIHGYVYRNKQQQFLYHGPFQTYVEVYGDAIWRRIYQWRGFFNKNKIKGNAQLTVYMKVDQNNELILLQNGSQNFLIQNDEKSDIQETITKFLHKNFGIDSSLEKFPSFKKDQ